MIWFACCRLVLVASSCNRLQKALGILQYVNPELKEVYRWLEEEFHPLQLCQKLSPIFEWLKTQDKLAQYVAPLRQITLMRLMKQVCSPFQLT